MATILLIDDSKSVLESTAYILEQAGHRVVTAPHGKEGLKLLRHAPVDLVITDIYMPEEDGIEVITKLRKLSPRTPVIAISGVTGKRGMLKVARTLGARHTLLKPFSCSELLDAVESSLRPAAADPAQPFSLPGRNGRMPKS